MYRHTQVGWVIIGFCAVFALVFAWVAWTTGGSAPNMLLALVPAAVLPLFSTLTVTVDDEALDLRFGPGLIGRRFPLAEIRSCEVVRNPWWWGWGIKLMWGEGRTGGWLYNVSGVDAVELRMKDGSVYRVGTDQPYTLSQAINSRLGQ